jgi:peptidoglycan/LPS O-acetylase OafA/YrhL
MRISIPRADLRVFIVLLQQDGLNRKRDGSRQAAMRNKRLDILRGIAVLLVIFYHGTIQNPFTRAGWAGVDLFFVLSGFLISALLFVEYKKTGSINFKRFFIRRGLKLYPAFYVFLLLTLVAESLFHHVRPLGTYLSEMFYVQNYGPSLWPHTWSLAVRSTFIFCFRSFCCFSCASLRMPATRFAPYRRFSRL